MLDSIQVKKRLAKRGFTDDQAEGLAEELATFTESNLATKDDLDALRGELRGDMDGLREELREDMGDLREELRGDMGDLREELRGDMDERFEQVDEQFAKVDDQFAAVDKQFAEVGQQIAEVKGEFAWWALRIVLAQAAVTAALLALYGFAS